MNNLLPTIDELVPILSNKTTFYNCDFNKPFNELDFEQKLKIINDLVRQTIYSSFTPNPLDESQTLIGNCHTASIVSINYMKRLNIGFNHRYVFARKRKYDPDNVTTKHAMVLVDYEKGNTYQFDASPYVGYKYGVVEKLGKVPLYEEYEVIENTKLELLNNIRNLIYKFSINKISEEELSKYFEILNESLKYPILNGYTAYCYRLLSNYASNKYNRDVLMLKSFVLNPYSKENIKNIDFKHSLVKKQIILWREELNELLLSNLNLKRQLELAQNIVQETKLLDKNYEKWLNISGINIRLSHLTPRFFMEHGINVIFIKASAYHLGVRGTIRESFLKKGNGVINEYFVNLSLPTVETKLKPMLFSHPMGDAYERSMNGTSNVILLNEPAEKLYVIKKKLRVELGKNIINKEVMWTDGQKILWHPFVTNLIHSTDNPSETCLHYLIGFPEHQLMTRFMYPNPKLER